MAEWLGINVAEWESPCLGLEPGGSSPDSALKHQHSVYPPTGAPAGCSDLTPTLLTLHGFLEADHTNCGLFSSKRASLGVSILNFAKLFVMLL